MEIRNGKLEYWNVGRIDSVVLNENISHSIFPFFHHSKNKVSLETQKMRLTTN